jgi:Uncharacterized protein conserved in bacteria
MYGGAPQTYRPDSFRLQSVEPIGNYALQLNWADGHTYGIWTYDRLRAICPDCTSK